MTGDYYKDGGIKNQLEGRKFETLDSGQRQSFETGAQRDTQDGKPRFDLIPPLALKRVADLYARGAEKYNEWNWSKGMPYSRFYASGFRHLMQWAMGDRKEDHLSACVFNLLCIIHFEELGRKDLDDMPKWKKEKPDWESVLKLSCQK